MSKSNGKMWPYAIGLAIIFVFGACVATVVITHTTPIENSDTYMMSYHEADAKVNEIIEARIAFDKKYKIEYKTDSLSLDNSEIKYKITDIDGNAVDNAILKVIVTRPNNHKYDRELLNPSVSEGVYSFTSIKLQEAGRWDIMAKISIGNNERFYNLKADTRAKEAFEY